ncbi:MAG TPA: hypothetical protein VGV61_09705 [Thermoanaerobaculia bacterium]|nr:hypothetical protein [Thermoanaerobaculia bacterium]
MADARHPAPTESPSLTDAKSPTLHAPVLRLSVDQHTTELHTPFTVKVMLENPNQQPLFANGRLALAGEVWFEIKGAGGKEALYISAAVAPRATAADLIEVAPGKSLSRRYDLSSPYSIEDPGTYSLRAKYQNQIATDSRGRSAWTGVLFSEWHTFERGPRSAGMSSKVSAVKGWLGRARELAAQPDHAGALTAAQKGLAELGDEYRDASLRDATDQELAAAEASAKGDAARLAALNINTLAKRFDLWQRRLGYRNLVFARASLRAAELVLADADDLLALKLALGGLQELRDDLRFDANAPRTGQEAVEALRRRIDEYEEAHPDSLH